MSSSGSGAAGRIAPARRRKGTAASRRCLSVVPTPLAGGGWPAMPTAAGSPSSLARCGRARGASEAREAPRVVFRGRHSRGGVTRGCWRPRKAHRWARARRRGVEARSPLRCGFERPRASAARGAGRQSVRSEVTGRGPTGASAQQPSRSGPAAPKRRELTLRTRCAEAQRRRTRSAAREWRREPAKRAAPRRCGAPRPAHRCGGASTPAGDELSAETVSEGLQSCSFV